MTRKARMTRKTQRVAKQRVTKQRMTKAPRARAPTKRNGAKDMEDDAATVAKKKRLSRKSAAYHAAHKAAKDHGKTEEECKTLAKAVTQPHLVPPQIV